MARKDSALSPVSSAAVDPWQHSFSKSLGFMSKILHLQSRRRTLTRYNSGLSLPQVRAVLMPCVAFLLALQLFIGAVVSWEDGVWDDALFIATESFRRFKAWRHLLRLASNFISVRRYASLTFLNSPPLSRKSCIFWVNAVCLQLKLGSEPPQLTFYLMIDNSGPAGGSGTNLSQVAIRDSTSGIVPIRTEGRVVERGYQTFAIDSLSGKCTSENVTGLTLIFLLHLD